MAKKHLKSVKKRPISICNNINKQYKRNNLFFLKLNELLTNKNNNYNFFIKKLKNEIETPKTPKIKVKAKFF